MCGGGVALPMKAVRSAVVWWNGSDNIVCILVLWRLCCFSGIVFGLQWLVNISLRMRGLEAQDGAAVGVSWPLLFRLFTIMLT